MSDTDKTRPFWVRMAEQPGRTCRPAHDHRTGGCDLPPDPGRGWRPGARCRWVETGLLIFGRDAGCGCPMCTGRDFRREQRRRDRHVARRDARSAARRFRSGLSPDGQSSPAA